MNQQTEAADTASKPLATVAGEPLLVLPDDLYIPPDALAVFLERFEGPLDLLLYLIRRQNFDILNIPIAQITAQYMHYVETMQAAKLDLAAEYLLMAAMLAEIKSRLLLPRQATAEVDDDQDPRAELVRRLQLYEQFKQAAQTLDELPRMQRDCFMASAQALYEPMAKPLPEVNLHDLLNAMQVVLQRNEQLQDHRIQREPLSVRDKMTQILHAIQKNQFAELLQLFVPEEGRQGIVVLFMAVLELLKAHLIDIVQAEAYAPIYVQAVQARME
ncbi:MAG: segregation and condensation protein A [bacterium]